MKRPLLFIVIAVIAVALLALAATLVVQHNAINTQDAICTKYNIPERSCARANAAGYYCPSWDSASKISSQICISIK